MSFLERRGSHRAEAWENALRLRRSVALPAVNTRNKKTYMPATIHHPSLAGNIRLLRPRQDEFPGTARLPPSRSVGKRVATPRERRPPSGWETGLSRITEKVRYPSLFTIPASLKTSVCCVHDNMSFLGGRGSRRAGAWENALRLRRSVALPAVNTRNKKNVHAGHFSPSQPDCPGGRVIHVTFGGAVVQNAPLCGTKLAAMHPVCE